MLGNVSTEIKPSHLTGDSYLLELLETLGLSEYYPNKLGREEVYTITEYSLADNPSRKPEELSLYYLTNLLALNHQARWLKSDTNQQFSLDNEDDWLLQTNINADEPTPKDIHPLDVMAATFLCCDPIIRQDLVLKLWECKLAIPLVIQESEERAPKFFLWAMRSLVMKWKKIQEGAIISEERTIADYPMDTVSFIRFDRSNLSKSNLLNAVMFGNNPHDIFFHKDSEASNPNRQLAEGSVELAWYLPEGDKDNDFDDITAFANLRGDARKYPQQLKLIGEVSSHVVIFTSIEGLEDSAFQIVRELLAAGTAIILILTNKIIEKEELIIVNQFMTKFQNDRDRIAAINIVGKSQPEIRDEVKNKLKTIGLTANSKISLEDVAKIMEQGMEVDEEEPSCQQGITRAKEILVLVSQYPPEKRKIELLPLQSKWWKEWAQADKEAVRQKQNTSKEESGTYANKQYTRQSYSRQQQIDIFQQGRLPQITQLLLKGLFQENGEVLRYFIRQLKLGLDALSRVELPHLYAEYGEKIKQLAACEQSSELENNKKAEINRELQTIDTQITAQSFGLEHLLREIGQVYLALKAIGQKDRSLVEEELYQKLPRIAAELLLNGYPLEIMDGEVSSVPLEWIQAVLTAFNQLVQQRETKPLRIFTLSAMGIQSSGKSTLLNVMFGLQFAVSAGRCTKGIYLQPVKLSPELREQFKVDYIFVIDTEGIKSPEQSSDTEIGHDNELSTFVIGLSDLSLIKVAGENSTYLQDILPISVQAFLRMNQIEIQPKAKIVHRNIDTSSTEKLDKQNVTLNASLDKYTAIACENEWLPVRAFSNIIEFNLKKDVEYLGSLYKGAAARNPIDPDYSNSVKRLTSEIVYGIAPNHISSVGKFTHRIESLWNAIKRDNFVYGFKNVIEIQSRTKLNTCWSGIVEEFSEQVNTLVSTTYQEIYKCSSTTYLRTIFDKSEQDLSTLLETIWLAQKQKLEKFFEESEHEHQNTTKQWEASTFYELNDLRDRLRRESRQQIQYYQDSREAELMYKDSCSNYREKITKGITIFLQQKSHSKNNPYSYGMIKLREEFENLWAELLKEILITKFPPAQILLDTENILRDRYKNIYDLIVARKGNKSLNDCQLLNFYGNQQYYYCHNSQFNKSKISYKNILSINQEIQKFKDDWLAVLKRELYLREKQPYDPNYLNRFLTQTNRYFEEKAQDFSKNGFSLTRECQADLFMMICGYMIRRLEQIDERWRTSQDPITVIEREKKDFWLLFLKMSN